MSFLLVGWNWNLGGRFGCGGGLLEEFVVFIICIYFDLSFFLREKKKVREMVDILFVRVGVKFFCILNGCIKKLSMNGFYLLEFFVCILLYLYVFI